MRADRLLSILLLLQVNRNLTARELAKRLEVSERTILRDMDALSVAGVPVTSARGAGGGWALMEAYRTNLTGLNQSEVQALFLGNPAGILADLGLRQAAEAALIKLFAEIPAGSRREAEYARQRFHVDTAGWRRSGEDISALPVLQEAVWIGRKLRFAYRRADSEPVERITDPLGLVAKGNVWYLVAAVEEGIRTYRVSRIEAPVLLEDRCVRPEHFDLEAYWRQSSAAFEEGLPRYYATLRVAPSMLPWIRYRLRASRVERIDAQDADGWTTFRVRFDVEEEACQFALGLGADAEVLEPLELRDRVIEAAERVVRAHAVKRAAAK
jgi:predicted DNA-binding transcriptional regulator YafY